MEVRTLVKMNKICALSPQPEQPPRSYLWRGLCNLFRGFFRKNEGNEAEFLKQDLLVEKTKTSCLEEQLNRMKEDHAIEIEQLKTFFGFHIAEKEEKIKGITHDGIEEVKALFQTHEALKEENAVPSVHYETLRNETANLAYEMSILRQRNAELSQANAQLSQMNSRLSQQHDRDQQMISNFYRNQALAILTDLQ